MPFLLHWVKLSSIKKISTLCIWLSISLYSLNIDMALAWFPSILRAIQKQWEINLLSYFISYLFLMYWIFVFLFLYALFLSVCNTDGLSAKIVFFLNWSNLTLQKILKQFFSSVCIFFQSVWFLLINSRTNRIAWMEDDLASDDLLRGIECT